MTAENAARNAGQSTDTLTPIRCRSCHRLIGEASPGSRIVIRCRRCGEWNDARIPDDCDSSETPVLSGHRLT